MRRLLILLVVSTLLFALIPPVQNVSGAWWNNNWNYYIPMTIESDYIDTDLVGFPVLVVINSTVGAFCDGGDSIRFLHSNNVTEFNYEIERWVGGGTSYVWVNVTRIDSGTDTIFMMYYNNTGASDNQNAVGVWDNEYLAVYHMENTSDSTSNNRDLTAYNTPTLKANGKISRAYEFNAWSNEYMNDTDFYDFTNSDDATVEAWFYHEGFPGTGTQYSGLHLNDDAANNGYGLRLVPTNPSEVKFQVLAKNTLNAANAKTVAYDLNQWHYLTGTYNQTEVNVYFNSTFSNQDTANTNWTQFLSTRLEVGSNEFRGDTYHGRLDEIRISNIMRNTSYINATFHSTNQTIGFITQGNAVNLPSYVPLEPTDFTATTTANDAITLDWTQGVNATHTIIRRSYTGYPVTINDGALVCNITGVTFNDVDLNNNVRVYYRTWSYNSTTGNFSFLYNSTWNHTGPANPSSILGTPETSNLNISWTLGRDASHTLIIRKVGSFPTSITDGTEIYNNTGVFYVDNNVLQTYRYTLFSYNNTVNLYSDGVQSPWGALDVNCYDEDTLIPINFNVLVTTDDGSEIYTATNCSNTFRISVGELPLGAVGIHISGADMYNNHTETVTGYLHHQNTTTTYVQLEYTPNSKSATNVTCYNSTGGAEYYPSFVLEDDVITIFPDASSEFDQINVTYIADFYGHRWYYRTIIENTMFTLDSYLPPTSLKQLYIVSVRDETESAIKDAYVTVRRELNGSYANVSNFYTNGNGQASVYLIPDEPYKFVISKSGYETEYSDWTPSTVEEGHFFLLDIESTPTTEYYVFWNVIEWSVTPHSNGSMYISYNDTFEGTIDIHLYLYEDFNYNKTLKDTNTSTGDDVITYWITGLNLSRLHYMILHYNHTLNFTASEQPRLIILPINKSVTRTQASVEAIIVSAIGESPYNAGWVNIIACAIAFTFLLTFSPFNVGVGIISAGVSFSAVEVAAQLQNVAVLGIIGIVIILGIFYILTKGKPEDHI